MKQIFLLLICVLSLSSFSLLEEWIVYSPKDLGYKISFPKQPTEETKDFNGVEAKTAIYKSTSISESNLRYYTSYSIVPKNAESLSQKDLDFFYENAINGSVKNHKGVLFMNKPTTISGYKGRVVKMSIMDGKAIMNMKVVLVKDKYYGAIVYTQPQKDNNAEIDKFLGSLEIY
jgi:hypothetical protein